MTKNAVDGAGISYFPCRYGTSRVFFRGPRKPMDGRYVSFVGSTETYGKYLPKPFPTLVEERLGEVCVNFGCINASIDAFINEQMVLAACHDATMNVVQIMGAHNMSNRFFTVHPRRNDRFLRASTVLRAIYPEVDFSEYCFIKHLLRTLHEISPERFEIVLNELQEAWKARMRSFLTEVGAHSILLWFADHLPSDAAWEDRADPFQANPMFVTRSMIDSLRPYAQSIVVVNPTSKAMASGTTGMVFPPAQREAAAKLMGPAAHEEAAEALFEVLQAAIPAEALRRAQNE